MRLLETIGNGGVYLIAEMSANHAGSLENALEIVRAAKKAGADCIKIQTYTADSLTIPCDNVYFSIREGLWQGRTLHALYQQACTPYEWHAAIREACEKHRIDFLSTPFDQDAVDFLEGLGVEAYKIASFELTHLPLIRYAASKGKPLILSCGMACPEEIGEALTAARAQGCKDIVLMKCLSEYPAQFKNMNLRVIPDMIERFNCPVGFSDHSPGGAAAIAAVALGACVVEKHFCLSRGIKSPDSDFSMEPREFARMARDIRAAKSALGSATYALTEAEQKSRAFRRSIFAVEDIARGEHFTPENIRVIRPGQGLTPKCYEKLLGMKAATPIKRGEPVTAAHLSAEDALALTSRSIQGEELR